MRDITKDDDDDAGVVKKNKKTRTTMMYDSAGGRRPDELLPTQTHPELPARSARVVIIAPLDDKRTKRLGSA